MITTGKKILVRKADFSHPFRQLLDGVLTLRLLETLPTTIMPPTTCRRKRLELPGCVATALLP